MPRRGRDERPLRWLVLPLRSAGLTLLAGGLLLRSCVRLVYRWRTPFRLTGLCTPVTAGLLRTL